jgi:hypothetical protein
MSEGSRSHGRDLEKPIFFYLHDTIGKTHKRKNTILSFVGILLPLFCLIQTKEWYDWVLMLLLSIFG